ncbi:MAG TPA: universal stress protein [Mycobacteriales bacterium]|nr:universal stress protein [Mycobacteriales bacterium]
MPTTTMHAHGSNGQRAEGMPRIVVGVDGSEQSLHALRWAVERARSSGEQVEPVYVFTSVPPIDFSGFAGPVPVQTSLEELAAAAGERLSSSVQRAVPEAESVVIEPQVLDAQSPVAGLVGEAAGASTLVLGVHRRHWMDGAIGSTARACLKHAPCAVVVVPEPAPESPRVAALRRGYAT